MPRNCCGGGCSCVVEGGPAVTVEGSGTAADPFVISADMNLTDDDNSTFDISITGSGTVDDPYTFAVDYASTALLSDIPDVSDTPATNGQVLAYDTGTGLWTPAPPTTASAGSVIHDTSLDGDGSVGDPLAVVPSAARFLSADTDGVGLTDDGINSLVRRFANDAARTAADPAPDLNTLSALDTAPGEYETWDGTEWTPLLAQVETTVIDGELLQLSGAYDGRRTAQITKQFSALTQPDGSFTLLTSTDLAGLAGVLSVQITPTGANPWVALLAGTAGQITGVAYQLSGGVFASQNLSATVTAVVY